MARRRSHSLGEAADYFKRAVDLDPQFALAYSRLGEVYQLLSEYGSLSGEEA